MARRDSRLALARRARNSAQRSDVSPPSRSSTLISTRTRTLSLRRRRISALKYGFGNPLPARDLAGAAPTAPSSMAFFQTSQFTSSALSRRSSPATIRRSISAVTNELTSAVASRRRRREYGHDGPAPPRRRDFRRGRASSGTSALMNSALWSDPISALCRPKTPASKMFPSSPRPVMT